MKIRAMSFLVMALLHSSCAGGNTGVGEARRIGGPSIVGKWTFEDDYLGKKEEN